MRLLLSISLAFILLVAACKSKPTLEVEQTQVPVSQETAPEQTPPVQQEESQDPPAAEENIKEEEPAAAPAAQTQESPQAEKTDTPDKDPEEAQKARQEELDATRKRIQGIYQMGEEHGDENVLKLLAMVEDSELAPHERAAALRALGRVRRDELVDKVKELTEVKEVNLAAEAVIVLYKWGEWDFAMPKLSQLQEHGVPLRRAFFKGRSEEKFEYDENARDFFEKGIKVSQPHVRLDAALGLLHLGEIEKALPLFVEALSPDQKNYVRLTALNYLAGAAYIPEVDALLFKALEDKDAKMASRARQIIGPRAHPRQAPQPAVAQ